LDDSNDLAAVFGSSEATIEYGLGSVTTSAKLINDLLGIAA